MFGSMFGSKSSKKEKAPSKQPEKPAGRAEPPRPREPPKQRGDLSTEQTALKVANLGEAYAPIAAEIRDKHVDAAFLRSLNAREVDETLAELGATSRVLRRRIAYELNLRVES